MERQEKKKGKCDCGRKGNPRVSDGHTWKCATILSIAPERATESRDTTKSLNHLVIRADTEANEWTFSGEIWAAINKLNEEAYQRGVEEERARMVAMLNDAIKLPPHSEWQNGYTSALKAVRKFLTTPNKGQSETRD